MESFFTIAKNATAEIVEKKSRFIAHVAHVENEEQALAFLENVRTEHRMARHNVYAYVLREGQRTRYSDDGEPAKTAGLPILQTIQHASLTDVIVVVTRYFGGTLLGTGGLVRAYTQATQAGLETAGVSKISACIDFSLEIPYGLFDQVMHIGRRAGAIISEPEFSDVVRLTYTVLEADAVSARVQLADLVRDQGTIQESEPYHTKFITE